MGPIETVYVYCRMITSHNRISDCTNYVNSFYKNTYMKGEDEGLKSFFSESKTLMAQIESEKNNSSSNHTLSIRFKLFLNSNSLCLHALGYISSYIYYNFVSFN